MVNHQWKLLVQWNVWFVRITNVILYFNPVHMWLHAMHVLVEWRNVYCARRMFRQESKYEREWNLPVGVWVFSRLNNVKSVRNVKPRWCTNHVDIWLPAKVNKIERKRISLGHCRLFCLLNRMCECEEMFRLSSIDWFTRVNPWTLFWKQGKSSS